MTARSARTGDVPRPVYVVWELTLRCDLGCQHCGSRAGKARANELDTGEALRLVDELAEMGAVEVTLIGGEAYLRDDWQLIAAAIVRAGMRATLTTGGRGMGAERARECRSAGIHAVSVSIDGMRDAHDRQRGLAGSFDHARTALRHLAEAGVEVNGNTQLNRLSLPDLGRVLELLIEERARGWQVQLTVPMGRAAEQPDWLLQPYELLELYPRLAELARRATAHGVGFWPANNIGYYGPHEGVLRGRGIDGERHWHGCPAGKYALGIESDGTIKGCPSLPTSAYAGGNVREQRLSTIWNETRELRYTRDRGREDLWGYCHDCYYADECRAGCTWTSHVFFGRPGNNPYCHHRALDHAERGLAERLVMEQPAPGTPFDHGRFRLETVALEQARKPGKRALPVIDG